MRHHLSLPKSRVIYTIAIIGFIAAIHTVLPTYSNSSFLSLFTSAENVGLIYMISSAFTILGFLFVPALLRKAGNYIVAVWLILIQIGLFYGLTVATEPVMIFILFIAQTAVIGLIGFCLDIFLETYSDVKNVGRIRGMYLTVLNTAWVLGPLIGSMIIGSTDDYRGVYVAALYMLFPLLYLVYKNFPRFKDPHYTHPSLWQTVSHVSKNRDHSKLFVANTILQTFYAWMVVYSPIYLHNTIGFSWGEIGIILTIMLLPFPLAQWPLGKLADRKYGEREIMTLGFALIGLATIALAGIVSTNLWVWALALLLTRVGAAAVEVMIETYFFKTVKPKDSNTLGFFRITRPLSFFIAPLITTVGLLFTDDQSVLFIILGILCLLAIIPSWTIRDTN